MQFATAMEEDNHIALKQLAARSGQGHLFQFWDELTDDQKRHLVHDLEEMDFERIMKYFKVCTQATVKLDDQLEPPASELCGSVKESDAATLEIYENEGLRAIYAGQVCALLLAGGQGTRLGVSYPKGMYQVGLPSGRTLYQIQAERLARVKELAKDKFGAASTTDVRLPWYIMTSEHTQEATEQFFKSHNYFGLPQSDVILFEQFTLPAITQDGKIILEEKFKVAKAPDGNGGLYRALREHGILADMKSRGIRHVYVYGVDNILVRMADPRFIGFCIHKGADCGNKVVEKTSPSEPLGVLGVVGGKNRVVEYSEISAATAALRLPGDDSRLVYRAGNICNHYFSRVFLERVCQDEVEFQLAHHVAKKKVSYVDLDTGKRVHPERPNAIKMEKFVFDVFPFANQFAVWEVERDHEFSPLKNGPGTDKDSPVTCRAALLNYHAHLARRAGALWEKGTAKPCVGDETATNGIKKEVEIEISPLVSYDGEGLAAVLEGKVLHGRARLERGPKGIELLQVPSHCPSGCDGKEANH